MGNFDPLLPPHIEGFKELKLQAESRDMKSLVLIFRPRPLEALKLNSNLYLNSATEVAHEAQKLGIDYIKRLSFTKTLTCLPPERFFEVITERIHLKLLLMDSIATYGRGPEGKFKAIQGYAPKYGFVVNKLKSVNSPNPKILYKLVSMGYVSEYHKQAKRAFIAFCYAENYSRNRLAHFYRFIFPKKLLLPPDGFYRVTILSESFDPLIARPTILQLETGKAAQNKVIGYVKLASSILMPQGYGALQIQFISKIPNRLEKIVKPYSTVYK